MRPSGPLPLSAVPAACARGRIFPWGDISPAYFALRKVVIADVLRSLSCRLCCGNVGRFLFGWCRCWAKGPVSMDQHRGTSQIWARPESSRSAGGGGGGWWWQNSPLSNSDQEVQMWTRLVPWIRSSILVQNSGKGNMFHLFQVCFHSAANQQQSLSGTSLLPSPAVTHLLVCLCAFLAPSLPLLQPQCIVDVQGRALEYQSSICCLLNTWPILDFGLGRGWQFGPNITSIEHHLLM